MLVGARPNLRTRRKVARLRPSLGSFCVFLGTDLDVAAAGVTDANIWHYGGDVEAGYRAIYDHRLPDEPSFFLTAPTLKDPETPRAPAGHHTIELISFVPTEMWKPWFHLPAKKRGPAYAALKREVADKLLAAAERYLPGLRDHILVEESGTPATVWHYVRGREGGIYGPENAPDQSPPRRFTTGIGVPGLFLAGASVFGCGVLPCLMSGAVAGRACTRYLDQPTARVTVPALFQQAGRRLQDLLGR
jgi:phytoene dehydrogenase-like protein